MTQNPLPPSDTPNQDAADRPPIHTETKVQALTELKADIEAAHVKGVISTEQMSQGLAAIRMILDLLDLLT